MFTLDDSIRNLCTYIKDNYKYLLPHEWIGIFKKSTLCIYTRLRDNFDDDPDIEVYDDQIYLCSTKEKAETFIKIFQIPDFHIDCCITPFADSDKLKYQNAHMFHRRITSDPILSEGGLYYARASYPDLASSSTSVDVFRRYARGLRLNHYYTERVNQLFESMPNLKYIWIDNIEYTNNNGVITNCEFDYRLRIASLHYRNELLKSNGVYASRYCIYNRNYSKH